MQKQIIDYYLLYKVIYNLNRKHVYNDNDKISIYRKRILYEWKIITQLNFSAYFLILYDIIKWAKEQDILIGDGRGSAGGSLICYLLNITNIDPIKFDLDFDRFVNASRVELPDIDTDIDSLHRSKLIDYIKSKYGNENVVRIGTHGIMKLKMTLKNICKVFNYDFRIINDITKAMIEPSDVERRRNMLLRKAFDIEKYPSLKNWIAKDKKNEKMFKYSQRLEGHIHHLSIHPAGILIIGDNDKSILPLIKYKGECISAWTEGVYRKELTKLGFLKYDLLGLNNLTIAKEILNILKKTNKWFYNDIPLDDKKTYKLFQSADMLGIFQFESGTARSLLKKIKPTNFNHLTAINSLNRPGPLVSGLDKIYESRKNKLTADESDPIYKILSETYGVIIYQEQYLKIAKEFALFNPKECNTLRKILNKSSIEARGSDEEKELFRVLKEKFVSNCDKTLGAGKGIDLWNTIEKFAFYAFNKSHSCAYAMLAYKLGYLKANYPHEFYLANIRHSNFDKLKLYYSECKSKEIKILPMDVNNSSETFSIDNGNIRYGFSNIKHCTKNVSTEIAKGRPYKSFNDFLEKIKLLKMKINKTAIIALIKAGAFDSLTTRNDAFNKYWKYRKFKEENPYKHLNDIDTIMQEKEVYNFIISDNIFQNYLKKIASVDVSRIKDFTSLSVRRGNIYAFIENIKKICTKAGNTMFFIRIFDGYDSIDLTVWTSDYYKNKQTIDSLKNGDLIYIHVKSNFWNGQTKLMLDKENNIIKKIK